MKSKTIVTGKVEILVVDLPEGSVVTNSLCELIIFRLPNGYIETENPLRPEEGFELKHLGKATELTEEDWTTIVDWNEEKQHFYLYPSKEWQGDITATESGLSLLKANGVVLENDTKHPKDFKYKPQSFGWYKEQLALHEEAESKVWHNCHVFIKQK